MNFEKARLSQADADHDIQEIESTEAKIENTTDAQGESKVMLQDVTKKCKDVNCVERKPGVEHGSHRDDEARELDLSGYTGLVQ